MKAWKQKDEILQARGGAPICEPENWGKETWREDPLIGGGPGEGVKRYDESSRVLVALESLGCPQMPGKERGSIKARPPPRSLLLF